MGRLTEYFGRKQRRRSYVPDEAKAVVERIRTMRVDESKVAELERREHLRFRPGPLQAGFSFEGLTRRERCAARVAQLLPVLRRAVDANDRMTYDSHVDEFDKCCDLIEGRGWGEIVRSKFTDWE